MSDLPPLTALRSFEAVARLGSISQAASELHVTHSAISQQIKLLENLLGLALFVREGRGLRLSENGRFYALQVRASLGEIADATRVVRARPREGELVVGASWRWANCCASLGVATWRASICPKRPLAAWCNSTAKDGLC